MSVLPSILLIGNGAMAGEIHRAAEESGQFRVGMILVREERREEIAARYPDAQVICSVAELTEQPVLAAECATHAAVREHVPALLRRGIDTAIASVGVLSDATLDRELDAAAEAGGAQLIVAAGAVPGIDALNAATVGGLDRVTYVSRKPPKAWKGTPAEQVVDLDNLDGVTVFYTGTAREAARDYPKNANVAATVGLSGLGMDQTQVRLTADPGIDRNIHEIEGEGTFGLMHLVIEGRSLPSNPKTSALAAYSMVRAIRNKIGVRVI